MQTRLRSYMATTLTGRKAALYFMNGTRTLTLFIVLCISVLGGSFASHSRNQLDNPGSSYRSDHQRESYHIRDHLRSYSGDQPDQASQSRASPRLVFDLFHQLVPFSGMALRPVPGRHTTAFQMLDDRPGVEVSQRGVRAILDALSDTDEFTMLAAFRLDTKKPCSILSITSHSHRLLDIELRGQTADIRLSFEHHGRLETERFPMSNLTQGQWYLLAVSISRTFVQIFLDCELKYERHVRSLDLFESVREEETPRRRDLHMWLGQTDSTSGLFKGRMEYLRLAMHREGYIEQCPLANTACPTCSQFRDLEKYIKSVHDELEDLRQQLHAAQARISELESCDCKRSCHVDDVVHEDGQIWMKDNCTECRCTGGSVECQAVACPEVTCENPVLLEGSCCQQCLHVAPALSSVVHGNLSTLGGCLYNHVPYEHGQGFTLGCDYCFCNDSEWSCKWNCPQPQCPPEEQIKLENHCCKVCRGPAGFCSSHNNCHPNASCYNLNTTYTCLCHDGFDGNGTSCEDRNECLHAGDPHGHHCLSNSVCVNVPGSYRCLCNEGYRNSDSLTCEDRDECEDGTHACEATAECINTPGSYTCQCREGYILSQNTCQPVCEEPCENRGSCVAPNLCLCREGFTGSSCQSDVDECSTGSHRCHPHSICINTHGSYFCRCRHGYHSFLPNNQYGALCTDIDECRTEEGESSCPFGSRCINTLGSFTCNCTEPGTCNTGCSYRRNSYNHGDIWDAHKGRCSQCECMHGNVECTTKPCDCNDPNTNFRCCPHCKEAVCIHNNKSYYEKDIWMSGCQICMCHEGVVDCGAMECPPLLCSPTIQLEGDCCPQCVAEDPCLDSSAVDNHSHNAEESMCYFQMQPFANGQSWSVHNDGCTSCSCKHGQVCCSYNETCRTPEHQQHQQQQRSPHTVQNMLLGLLSDDHRFVRQYHEGQRRRERKNPKKRQNRQRSREPEGR